jgi:hypothetical protein
LVASVCWLWDAWGEVGGSERSPPALSPAGSPEGSECPKVTGVTPRAIPPMI